MKTSFYLTHHYRNIELKHMTKIYADYSEKKVSNPIEEFLYLELIGKNNAILRLVTVLKHK